MRFMAKISITFRRCETESNKRRIPSKVRLKIRSEAKGSYTANNMYVHEVCVCMLKDFTYILIIYYLDSLHNCYLRHADANCLRKLHSYNED